MNGKVSFRAFEPLLHDAPQLCNLCLSKAPAFKYEYHTEEHQQEKNRTGFCCLFCAPQLLKKLASVESHRWAEEEAALKADNEDTSDIHARRLATFGANK
jgi:hypothetical protein